MTMASYSVEAFGDDTLRAAQLIEGVVGDAWAADALGALTYLTPARLGVLGLTLDILNAGGALAPGWSRLVHADDAATAAAVWNRSLLGGEAFDVRVRILSSAGAYAWGRCSGQPMRDGQGRITGWYGALLYGDSEGCDTAMDDPSLGARERELSELLDLAPSHIWRLTPQGEPTFFNKCMTDYLGLSVAEMKATGQSGFEALLPLVHPLEVDAFGAALTRSLATGESLTLRYRLRRADGVYRWMSSRAKAICDPSGAITGWCGVCHDVDDQVRGEQALERSERHLQRLIDALPVYICSWTVTGELTLVNKRNLEHLGFHYEPNFAEFSEAAHSLVHPDDAPRVRRAATEALASGVAFSMRYRRRAPDGAYRWLDGRFEPLHDPNGRIVEWFGIAIDIDEIVNAQDALREHEKAMSRLVDVVPAAICRLAPDGEMTFFNKRLIDFLGVDVTEYDRRDISRLSTIIAESVHPDDRDAVSAEVAHSLATGRPYAIKYRLRRADGVFRWTETRGEPLRDPSGTIVEWYSVTIDVDDQMRLFREGEEREAKIRRLVDSDVIGVVIWDLDGTLIDANDAFLRMVQYERQDVEAGLRWLDMTPPDWQAVHAQEEAAELAATGKMQAREKEYFRKDGSRVPILIGAACFEDQSSQGVAFILDLTERKRVEQALRESERALWELVETLPVMIDCAAPDGEPLFRSRRLREFLGYNLEELQDDQSRLEITLDNGVHPDDLEGVKEHYAHSLATGEPYARRHRLRRFDGEYRWVETRAAPMRNAEGAIVQWNVICLDIDAEVRVEEELRLARERLARASQAASLAELSASIAHEVNQPLAAVVANSHACQRWLNADPPNLQRAQTTIDRIIRDANSAADVVSRIRALFRQTVETRSISTLGAVIAEVRELMVDAVRRAGVTMQAEIDPNIPEIEFDPIQIQQVLVNLTRNAVEAMEATEGPRILRLAACRKGDAVRFEVGDTGPGVEHPEKVLDPFYTTKESGMGMGLAISRSIVESHGGTLSFDRSPAGGTTFSFTLPIRPPEAP
jgi:PAS domain S-box-containing protein